VIRRTLTWLRLTFRISSSTPSWQERAGDVCLIVGLVAAIGLMCFTPLHWWQALLIGVLCLTPAIALNRMGWLKVFGPVLYYDLIRQARQSRFIWIRFLYCCLLVVLLLYMTIGYITSQGDGFDVQSGPDLAQSFFDVFLAAQLIMVAVLTPAYVAGAIADERDRKTLEFIFATDLLNREIVLSKLGSRLANLGLIILTGLPILSFLQFLGGVDPNLVLAGFAITGLTALGEAGVSIYFSTTCKSPRDAIVASYGVLLFYIVITMMLWIATNLPVSTTPIWFGEQAPTLADVAALLNMGSVVLVFTRVQMAGATGTLATDLPPLVRSYALFHGLLALACTALAIARLRRDTVARTGAGRETLSSKLRAMLRPAVSNAPMTWKEMHCEAPFKSFKAWLAVYAVILAITLVPIALIADAFGWYQLFGITRDEGFKTSMNVWARCYNVAVGCLTLLAVAVRASTSITRERSNQTWENLITTTMDSSPIAFGKWLGSIYGVRWGMMWLLLIWSLAVFSGGMHPFAWPLAAIAWLAYASFAASLGLWFSAVSKSSTKALMLTVLFAFGLGAGHWFIWICCSMAFLGGGGSEALGLIQFQAGVLTPPFVMAIVPFQSVTLDGYPDWNVVIFWSVIGVCSWGAASWLLYQLTNARLRLITHRDGLVATRAHSGSSEPGN